MGFVPSWHRAADGERRRPDDMSAPTLLIVDDEPDLVELIQFNLERRNYRVLTAHDGQTAVELAAGKRPDLIILDIMLPKASGRDVIVALKNNPATRSIPIIMLTALSAESDVIAGLQMGADDYVTKPFSVDVLMARIAAVLRRPATDDAAATALRAGPVTVDRARHVVELDGEAVALTLAEFRLLEALVTARSRVLTRDQLISRVMGPTIAVTDRTIDVHVASLRRKLGEHRDLVQTVRGIGYRFADVWQDEPIGC